MEYLIQLSSFFAHVLELDSVRVATVVSLGMEYMDLTVVLASALLASVGVDQISLLRGKFTPGKKAAVAATLRVEEKPLPQFLKHHFYAGIFQQDKYLSGAEKIGHLRFFLYNMISSCIWLAVLVMAAAGLRALYIEIFGNFGPFELELIAGIIASYIIFLGFLFINKDKHHA